MSQMRRILGASLAVLSGCAPQPEFEEVPLPPNRYIVQLFVVSPPEELGPDCEKEVVLCDYYSDYGAVFVFKCDSRQKTKISTLEKTISGRRLWYHAQLSQDLNNQTFSEYCKNTFDNYIQFMKETGY